MSGRGKGHQEPHMGSGTSQEMFWEHCMGALHTLHADGNSDPSAVCGGLYEMLNSRSVVVDHAGIPGLLGASGRARRRKSEDRRLRRHDDMNGIIWNDMATI